MKNKALLPQHVAIIMDGNRRWARKQKLPIIKGHRKVAEEMIERLADFAIEKGIKYLTLWVFSTENWQREESEVSGLMDLFRETFSTSSERLHKKGVRINSIGDLRHFSTDIQKGIEQWKEVTRGNNKLVVTFALNYGGRDEIIRANRRALLEARAQNWSEEKINNFSENDFSQFLDTNQDIAIPDPDLLIRPGGEERLSGFLPWQLVYTELYFTELLMPDFDELAFSEALDEYARRNRRFGK